MFYFISHVSFGLLYVHEDNTLCRTSAHYFVKGIISLQYPCIFFFQYCNSCLNVDGSLCDLVVHSMFLACYRPHFLRGQDPMLTT